MLADIRGNCALVAVRGLSAERGTSGGRSGSFSVQFGLPRRLLSTWKRGECGRSGRSSHTVLRVVDEDN